MVLRGKKLVVFLVLFTCYRYPKLGPLLPSSSCRATPPQTPMCELLLPSNTRLAMTMAKSKLKATGNRPLHLFLSVFCRFNRFYALKLFSIVTVELIFVFPIEIFLITKISGSITFYSSYDCFSKIKFICLF